MNAHFDTSVYHPTFDFNHAVYTDALGHFHNLAHEYNLPDDVVQSAVHSACIFMQMNDLDIKMDNSTGVYTHDPTTLNDDVLGFSRDQMLQMGIHDEQSLSLICTHEVAHCMLQYLSQTHQLSNWQEELSCDAFMGVRAAIEGIDTHSVEESLGRETPSPTHPNGELRMKYIEIGKEIGEDLKAHGIPVTADNILARLNDHIKEDAAEIFRLEAIVNEIAMQQMQSEVYHGTTGETTGGAEFVERANSGETTGGVGFHGITYTASEIAERRHRVEDCEDRVRRLQHELELLEYKERALRGKEGSDGEHRSTCYKISDTKSKIHSANIDLKNARHALNLTL